MDGTFRFGHKSFLEYLAADYSERKHAGTEDEDIYAIDSVMDVAFEDVLRNNVVRSYFGELLIWRRAGDPVSQLAPTAVASFLLDQILRPSWFTKKVWYISVAALRHHDELENTAGLRGALYRHVVHPLSTSALLPFVASRYDRSSLFKFQSLSFMSIFFIPTLFFSVFRSYIPVTESTAITIVLIYVLTFIPMFMFKLKNISDLPRRRRMNTGKTWVDVCRDQGCLIEHLYAALHDRENALADYRVDPAGIFTARRVEPEIYAMESEETLRNKAIESNIAWNRGVAAWVLGRRHSEFGGFVFSKDVDGLMPPRDPRDAVKVKLIQKAGMKAGVKPEELTHKIESLNSFLGWDLRNGNRRK